MNEHDLQSLIRVALSTEGTFFRSNVGTGWTGDTVIKQQNGDIFIKKARPFSSGMVVGFPDIFGAVPVTITPDMVGQTVAIFAGIEVKTPTGRIRPEQQHFIDFMRSIGARAGIARSIEQAVNIARGTI